MTPERLRQIEELYHAVRECEGEERRALLDKAGAELRREVESLLMQDRRDGPMERPVASLAAKFMGDSTVTQLGAGAQLGPYRIEAPLGAGGMGRVYRGLDTRLNRAVAIKISTEQFSQRFERETRMISALNHPHICTLHDIGMLPSGGVYMVTELVEGETLRDWIKRSPAADRRIDTARQILEALKAAHAAGVIHRDLKPANIMVRFDGYVKVLDFGLAKRIAGLGATKSEDHVTAGMSVPGQVMGTLAYMSPEQILGQELDPRSDLFAFGIILYEMLAGEHPWPHKSKVDVMHAILHDDPPPIESAWDGVLDKLLRKNRGERYASAEKVLDALIDPALSPPPRKRTLTRLIVLPFRILRPHESSDFLSLSLPDAITSSLAAIDSLLVRSTMVAAKLASTEYDVKTISEEAQVDAILTGSILSDGENLRVNTQLVQAPDGALVWSDTSQVSLQGIFRLQDSLVDRIVQSLAVPLTAREQRALKHDVPASALGYEFFLRANQLIAGGYNAQNMLLARDLYLQSVDADPKYAPAWACLARAHRYIGKFVEDSAGNLARAEEAFQTAFALNPDLALAHNFYTAHETDLGRSLNAMARLLKRAQTHQKDPSLLTGLVQACRYCGLLEASVAAHDRAKQLDPNVKTSVAYSYLHLDEFQKALDHRPAPVDLIVAVEALEALGRKAEAITMTIEYEKGFPEPQRQWFVCCRAALEGDYSTAIAAFDKAPPLTDPEARFWHAIFLARVQEHQRALEFLSKALDGGYRCHHGLLHHPLLQPLRSDARFTELVKRAAVLDREARSVFLENEGDRLLGVHVDRDAV